MEKEGKGMKRSKSSSKWNITGDIIFPVLCLTFTFFFYGPVEVFLTNRSSFDFQPPVLLLESSICFLIATVILLAICVICKKHPIIKNVIFGIALALYIQGNWMFVSYGKMDGTAINWHSFGIWPYINAGIWIVLIALPIIVGFIAKWRTTLTKIIIGISAGIIGIECLTLCTLGITMHSTGSNTSYYVAKDDHMLELSKNHNVIVMMFDGFQASYFQQIIDESPELEEAFSGFVFFDNAVGTSLWSEEGGATILTGRQLRVDLPFSENIDYVYTESPFFPALVDAGYDVRYYEATKMVSPLVANVIENIVLDGKISVSYVRLAKIMNKITAFKYMPHFLKRYFVFSYLDTSVLTTEIFQTNDAGFNEDILNGSLSVSLNQDAYRFYYFKGPHPPYNLDENGNVIQYDDDYVIDYVADLHDNEMLYRQTRGSVQIMVNFLNALKEIGIYDQTDIVIAADHGWENRYNPLMLIKPQNANGSLTTSHAPVSYIEDYAPTIMSMITSNDQEERTVFDYEEGEQRTRLFYVYDINADRSYNSISTIFIDENGVHSSSQPLKDDEIHPYHVGDIIEFSNDPNSGVKYFQQGLSTPEGSYVWSLGNKGRIRLVPDDLQADLLAEFTFLTTLTDSQRLIIKSNDDTLFDDVVTIDNLDVHFVIPRHCFENGTMILDLEYPDAVSPSDIGINGDARILGLKFQKIQFVPITDK